MPKRRPEELAMPEAPQLDPIPEPESPALSTKAAVFSFLLGQGYILSKSKVYNDAKHQPDGTPPLLTPNAEGVFDQACLERYVKTAGLRKKTGQPQTAEQLEIDDLARRKAEASAKAMEVKAEREQMELDLSRGDYIERARVEDMLAARARVLKSSLLSFGRIAIEEVISLTGGNLTQAPAALAMYEEAAESWLGAYAQAGELSAEAPH